MMRGQKKTNLPSMAAVQDVLRMIQDPHARSWVQFCASTGLRASEMRTARWSWIRQRRSPRIVIPDRAVRDGPGRTVPLDDAALEALRVVPPRANGLIWGPRPPRHQRA